MLSLFSDHNSILDCEMPSTSLSNGKLSSFIQEGETALVH